MTTSPISLKGCFPPIPTPFDEKGNVAHDHLADNLRKWQDTPLSGSVVLGSNGEAALLKADEKLAVWKTAGQVISGDHLFIAGTGCDATGETMELTEAAAHLGAHAAMVVTPHYYKAKMDHRALVSHYAAIADRAPIPIILYNVPAFTGVDLSAETIIELAGHPNIVGLKESSGNVVKMGEIVYRVGGGFQVLAGSGGFLLPALSIGAVGGVMALAAVAPDALAGIIDDFQQGNMAQAREAQLRLISANAAVTSRFGIAGLKGALDRIGMYGGPVRPPLRPLDQDQSRILDNILKEAGITTK